MEPFMQLVNGILPLDFAEFSVTTGTSFALIAAAEIGDKSQLVCMMLASRHRAMPVLWGAIFAFVLLNTLAVVFGSAIAAWLPEYVVATCIALLFAGFGLHALSNRQEENAGEVLEKSGHGIFLTTFLLIALAEFGDKTQLAVVAFSSTALPAAVWLGSTLALSFTSTLGVMAGSSVLQKIPLTLMHKASGAIFLALAAAAGYKAYGGMMAAGMFSEFIRG